MKATQERISFKMRQAEKYVDQYTKKHGQPPTYRKVQQHFGFASVNTAHARLRHCREKMNPKPEYRKKDKALVIDFLEWMQKVGENDPFALETDNDDIADMYLNGYYK